MKNKLHLNLKKKWFDMILSGEKTEEYRECSKYWCHRFLKYDKKGKLIDIDSIIFSNGYAKNRRQFEIEVKNLSVDHGIVEWGAEYNRNYFVFTLGKKLKTAEVKED